MSLRQDQDCWSGGNGAADTKPNVSIFKLLTGFTSDAVKCRRVRLECKGCYACSQVDPKLLNVARFELEYASRLAINNAEVKSRFRDGSTANNLAATYVIIYS